MFIEKKLKSVSARLLTANGSAYGLVQVTDSRGFYVKQEIQLKSSAFPAPILLEIKRFNGLNSFYVGVKGKIGERIDLSAYLVADGATIEAAEQSRPGISRDDSDRAVYMEEPIVAIRVYNVDEHGDSYNTQNPLPVRLTDGSVNIGSVNAELEVQLSAKDNVPNAGDVHDSIRIGDQNNELKINADGSINVNTSSGSPGKNTYNEVVAVVSGVVTTIVTYTVPAATLSSLEKISFSGQNIAEYTVLINNVPIDKTRTNFGSDLSGAFDFISKSSAGLILSSGDQVKLNVLHARPMVGSFESRIQVVEFT